MASWNPALRPDSAHLEPQQHTPSITTSAPPTASWNPAFRPNASPSSLDTKPSSSAPPPSPASPPSYSPSPPAAQPPSYTDAAQDVRTQVPFLDDEKTDAKAPVGAVADVGGEDLEAGAVVEKDKGLMARARGGVGMLCYVVVLCLTLGMFGCYSYAA